SIFIFGPTFMILVHGLSSIILSFSGKAINELITIKYSQLKQKNPLTTVATFPCSLSASSSINETSSSDRETFLTQKEKKYIRLQIYKKFKKWGVSIAPKVLDNILVTVCFALANANINTFRELPIGAPNWFTDWYSNHATHQDLVRILLIVSYYLE